MQYIDGLVGLRSQGYPNDEVTIRRYEIMQRLIDGVRNFEQKRNLALMYAPEQYVEFSFASPSAIPTHARLLRLRQLPDSSSTATTASTSQPAEPRSTSPSSSAEHATTEPTASKISKTALARVFQLR